MKLYVKASRNIYSFEPGDQVTVYEGAHGYANYDATFVETYQNRYGVDMAVVRTKGGDKNIALSSIIPSQHAYFYSLSLDDVLTKDFVAGMIYKDDAMWCDRINASRVDRDASIENIVGYDAYIAHYPSGYRVAITEYISKNYSTTSESDDRDRLSIDDPMITEALDILKSAPKVVVNFAGYQRIFTA